MPNYEHMQDIDPRERLALALRDAHPVVRGELDRLRRAVDQVQREKGDLVQLTEKLKKELAKLQVAVPEAPKAPTEEPEPEMRVHPEVA